MNGTLKEPPTCVTLGTCRIEIMEIWTRAVQMTQTNQKKINQNLDDILDSRMRYLKNLATIKLAEYNSGVPHENDPLKRFKNIKTVNVNALYIPFESDAMQYFIERLYNESNINRWFFDAPLLDKLEFWLRRAAEKCECILAQRYDAI